MKDLKAHLEAVTRFAKLHTRYQTMAIGHVLEGMSIARYYSNAKQADLEDIAGVFDSMADLENLRETCNFNEIRDEIGDYEGRLMTTTIALCNEVGIRSKDLLHELLLRFDRAMLQKTVNLEDVDDEYGPAEVGRWATHLFE